VDGTLAAAREKPAVSWLRRPAEAGAR